MMASRNSYKLYGSAGGCVHDGSNLLQLVDEPGQLFAWEVPGRCGYPRIPTPVLPVLPDLPDLLVLPCLVSSESRRVTSRRVLAGFLDALGIGNKSASPASVLTQPTCAGVCGQAGLRRRNTKQGKFNVSVSVSMFNIQCSNACGQEPGRLSFGTGSHMPSSFLFPMWQRGTSLHDLHPRGPIISSICTHYNIYL